MTHSVQRLLWSHLHEVRRLFPQSPGGRVFVCVFFFHLVCLCYSVFPPIQYIFHMPMARYSLFVLKVPLNTNKTNTTNKNLCPGNDINMTSVICMQCVMYVCAVCTLEYVVVKLKMWMYSGIHTTMRWVLVYCMCIVTLWVVWND